MSLATAMAVLILGNPLSATEVEFWRPYSGPDPSTYLLATFDNDAVPTGAARIERVEKTGTPVYTEGKFGQAHRILRIKLTGPWLPLHGLGA